MFCEKLKKRNRHSKYQKILRYNEILFEHNEILFEWYKRCCASNIYPNGVMLKEKTMVIKE